MVDAKNSKARTELITIYTKTILTQHGSQSRLMMDRGGEVFNESKFNRECLVKAVRKMVG